MASVKTVVHWTTRVILWTVFFFLFYLAIDIWKWMGIHTLERSLSRTLQGKVEIHGLAYEWPLGIRLQRFQVDSVLVVYHARIQWRPFLRIQYAEVLTGWVDLDTWLPRFWKPSSGPPRAPLFPPLDIQRIRITEARVRVGGTVYRASRVQGRFRMGRHHLEVPFSLASLEIPFRDRFLKVRGIYDLDYPNNQARHWIRFLEGAGKDTLRGGEILFYQDTLLIHVPRLFLREIGQIRDVSGWFVPRTRQGWVRIHRVEYPGQSLRNLSAFFRLNKTFQILQIQEGQADVENLTHLKNLQGSFHLSPPYPWNLQGYADSLTPQPGITVGGQFQIKGGLSPPYAFSFQGNQGHVRATVIESLRVRGVYTPERVRLDTLWLQAPWGSILFHGTVGPTPQGEFLIQAHNLPQALQEWTPITLEGGTGWIRIQLGDTLKGEVFAQYIEHTGFLLASLQGTFRIGNKAQEIALRGAGLYRGDSLLLDSLQTYAFLQGPSPSTPCSWEDIQQQTPGNWSFQFSRGSGHLLMEGPLWGTWPCISLRASSLQGSLASGSPHFEGVLSSERLSFFFSGSPPLKHLTGEVILGNGTYWVDAALDTFPLSFLTPFFQRPLNGTFSGILHAVGDPHRLMLEGSGSGENFQMDVLRSDRFQTAFRYQKPSLILDSLRLEDSGGSIRVEGQILAEPPYLLNLEAQMKGGGTPLFNELMKDLMIAERLQAYGNLRIQGEAESPFLSGEVALMGRNVLLIGTGTSLDSVVVMVTTKEETLQIGEVWGVAQGGNLEGTGWTRVVALQPQETRMRIRIQHLPVEFPLIYARLSGDLSADGILPVLRVRGDLQMDEAYIDARFGKLGGPQRAPQPSPLRLDLHLSAPSRVFLTNELADVEFSANLQVHKPDDINMYLQGDLTALSGSFLYLDRLFDIQEGKIQFQNDPTFNPELSLVARTVVDTYTIFLGISGTLQEPLFSLQSTPSLDTLSILSLLTLGTPRPTDLRQVAELSYLQGRVFSLAGALLASRFRSRVGLREFTWQPTGELTIGAMIGRNLYLRTWGDPRDFQNFSSRFEYYLSPHRTSSVYFERSAEGRISFGFQYEWNF